MSENHDLSGNTRRDGFPQRCRQKVPETHFVLSSEKTQMGIHYRGVQREGGTVDGVVLLYSKTAYHIM